MQTPLFQNFDSFDHLAALREYVPLLDQVINSDLPLDCSPTNQTFLSNFFQKCLIELKECKSTMSLQEDTLQSATEELIRLRELNNNLMDANQGLTNQIGNLQNFLHEADTIAISLRSEVNQLRHENRALAEVCEHFDFPSREESSRILSAQFDYQAARDKDLNPGSEKFDQESPIETLQQKEHLIRNLTQNIEELSGYREKYNQLLKESEEYKTLKDKVERLQEDLIAAKEENRKLNKSPEGFLRRLKSFEGVENPDKAQVTTLDTDGLWNLLNSKDDDCLNKNFLSRKSLAMTSPSKENVDLKKQSLLMESLLSHSVKSPNPLQKKNSDKKLNSHPQKNMALLNFGGIVKNNIKVVATSLIDAISESESVEHNKSLLKNNQEPCSSINSFREPKSSRKEKLNHSVRKHDDRVYLRETSFEIHNTSKNSEDLGFDELLSWEEGDFKRLNTSNITCNSPKFEPCFEENWIAKFESTAITKDLLSKDQTTKGNPQGASFIEYNVDRQKEESNNINRENKHIPSQEQIEKNQEVTSRLPPKIPTKSTEGHKTAQKKGQPEFINSARDQITFKETTTQTDQIEAPRVDNVRNVDFKAVNNNTWKSFVTLVTLLLSLIFIFISSRGERVSNREL